MAVAKETITCRGVSEKVAAELECAKQLEILKEKAWFFLDISYEQIQLILGLKEQSTFLVTNGAFYDQFVLYMSIKSLTDDIQLVKIDQKHCDDGFKYTVEGKEEVYSSVIEAVDSFSSSSESTLVPAVDSASRGRKFSQDSSDIDIDTPPNYTAASTFPGVIHSLPTVTTKVNTLTGEDADKVTNPYHPHSIYAILPPDTTDVLNRVRANATRNTNLPPPAVTVEPPQTHVGACGRCCMRCLDFCIL